MSEMAFEKIMEGLNEALAVARGEANPAKLHVSPEIDVHATRSAGGLPENKGGVASRAG